MSETSKAPGYSKCWQVPRKSMPPIGVVSLAVSYISLEYVAEGSRIGSEGMSGALQRTVARRDGLERSCYEGCYTVTFQLPFSSCPLDMHTMSR